MVDDAIGDERIDRFPSQLRQKPREGRGLSEARGSESEDAGRAFFVEHGFPGWTAYPVFAVELVGGVALVAGIYARVVALGLVPVVLGAFASPRWQGVLPSRSTSAMQRRS